jgi:hypothetical protein
VTFEPTRLVVAGFTGRDPVLVSRHIAELARAGIRPPPSVPAFYELPVSLLTTESRVMVNSSTTSGEVEAALLCDRSGWLVTVCSDHTDRELERTDILAGKMACPKVLGLDAIRYEVALASWDAIELRSWADGRAYQAGRGVDLLPIQSILGSTRQAVGQAGDGLVVLLGTIPLLHGPFVYAARFRGQLRTPDGSMIECAYEVRRRREAS